MRSPILLRLRLLAFGFGELLLPHQGPDFLRDAVALRLELLNLSEKSAPLLVQREHLENVRFITGMAGGESFTDEVGVFPYQTDVKHRGSIGMKPDGASPRALVRGDTSNWGDPYRTCLASRFARRSQTRLRLRSNAGA